MYSVQVIVPDSDGKYHCPGCNDVIINPGILADLNQGLETKVHCGKAGRFFKIKAGH